MMGFTASHDETRKYGENEVIVERAGERRLIMLRAGEYRVREKLVVVLSNR